MPKVSSLRAGEEMKIRFIRDNGSNASYSKGIRGSKFPTMQCESIHAEVTSQTTTLEFSEVGMRYRKLFTYIEMCL